MKKISNLKYLILSLLFIGIFSIACNEEENLGKKVKPELTANGETSLTVSEGTDAVLKFKLDKALNKPIQYRLVMLDESTATDQNDYVIPGCRSNDPDCVAIEENGGPVGYVFEIPAYTTEYSVNISTILDDFNEADEVLRLKVISNRTLLGTVNELFYNVTIQNSVSNDLSIRLNWSGTFMSGGEEIDNCELDMDLELYDASLNIIDDSYSSCPESIILNTATFADGTYYLAASLWDTFGYSENVNIPAKVTFIKQGTNFNTTLDVSSFFPMQDGGLSNGNSNALVFYTIVKSGNIYTITDVDNATVFQGKHVNFNFKGKTKRKK
jgi:hypothetical protein